MIIKEEFAVRERFKVDGGEDDRFDVFRRLDAPLGVGI